MNEEDGKRQLNVSCSCNVDVIGGRVVQPQCWHAETLFNDVLSCGFLGAILNERNSGNECPKSFGEPLMPRRTGMLFKFSVQKEHRSLSQQSVVRTWRFSIVYDDNLNMFVFVSVEQGKTVNCCLCRSSSTRRGFCKHELSCRPQSSIELVIDNGNENSQPA